MGFIKHALIGIALFQGIKYCLRNKTATNPELEEVILGGKHFAKNEHHPPADARHRHHLDRPEITAEPEV